MTSWTGSSLRNEETKRRIRLEATSQEFARELFSRHPEWQRDAGYYELEVGRYLQRFLEVRVPSAHPSVSDPLLIRTRPEEVYLDWGGWHDHVYWWSGQSHAEFIAEALAAIERWVSDGFLFASVYQGDRRVREWAGLVGDEHVERFLCQPSGLVERTVVRSWRGTHDRVILPESLQKNFRT
jgi:hypothetical protein